MCGIAGIYNLNQGALEKKELEKMIRVIRHRGPDGEGYFLDGNLGFGHCRLAITDLSPAASQPMENEDGTLIIVHNGEIFNFLEIRAELKERKHVFKSDSDTEVVLHAFEEWGSDCLKMFNGQWAFAIWDKKKKELFCSRDRLGIAPFYYCSNGKFFAFASEIKSLLELDIQRIPNDKLIYDFLVFTVFDHTNETFFDGVNKLPAACWMKIRKNGEISIKKYWDFDVSDEIAGVKRDEEYAEEFLDLLEDSIRIRLRGASHIGFLLSGGMDSSSIVCLVQKLLKKEKIPALSNGLESFSVLFQEKNQRENKYIEEVVAKSGIKINKNFVFPTADDFFEEIDKVLWHQEEPFLLFIYAQWKTFKEAAKKIRVLIDGQGGDENLCGYTRMVVFYLRSLFEMGKYSLFINEFLRFFSFANILEIKDNLGFSAKTQKSFGLSKLLNQEFFKDFQERISYFESASSHSAIGKITKGALTIWPLPAILRISDKSSMAHSCEVRLPFLDHRIVEKLASFPMSQKVRNGQTKVVLRNSMKGIVPDLVIRRKTKRTFVPPRQRWMSKNFRQETGLLIKNSRFIPAYADPEKIISRSEKFFIGKSDKEALRIFKFYILELWGRKFILDEKNNL